MAFLRSAIALYLLLEHDLFRKPASTFRDHALGRADVLPGRLMGQRIGPQLEVRGQRLGALAAFDQPRRAVAVGGPQATALPAGIRIVDAAVEALGVEAERVGNADRHHL